jgi:hypothetical protein
MQRRGVWLKIFIAASLVMASLLVDDSARCDETTGIAERSRGVWSFGLAASQVNLKSGEGEELAGFRSTSQLGWGYLAESWYGYVGLDIIAGPYESPRPPKIVVDYSGTGLSAGIALSAENQNLRTIEGNYGFSLSLQYMDITGRSVKTGTDDSDPGESISNWQARVQNLSIFPAIFFCWLQPARAAGNTPELLMTRVEGYILSIGLATPLQAAYSVGYEQAGESFSSKASVRGYTAIISLQALIGS